RQRRHRGQPGDARHRRTDHRPGYPRSRPAFGAGATDLDTGRTVWLREGSTIAAVRASCALPGLFPPVRREGAWLLDGGLVDPVPVTLCRLLGADIVIAVDLSPYRYRLARPVRTTPEPLPADAEHQEELRCLDRMQHYIH